jgi:hypothetical protein
MPDAVHQCRFLPNPLKTLLPWACQGRGSFGFIFDYEDFHTDGRGRSKIRVIVTRMLIAALFKQRLFNDASAEVHSQ